jgi:microcystin degradation protein MlrC
MRIGIAGFLHESNTFTSEMTALQHFQEAFLNYGDDLVAVWRDAHHELGGFIAGCEKEGVEIVPLMAASATPKGPVTRATYDELTHALCARLAEVPLDGLLLALHGAMVSEDHASADSETLRRVRAVIGELPLVLSLDMHGNVAPPMVHLPDATIAYRTYPHVDQRARGIECARLMARTVRGEVTPVQAGVKLPLLIHIVQQYTGGGAMAEVMSAVEQAAAAPGILSASLLPGYIYADVPDMGATAVVVADGDRARAESEAKRLAQFVFDRRADLNAGLPDVPTAVARAKQVEGTVCLMDSGDNIGGGGPGDSTVIFEEILRQHAAGACVVLYDPEAALACAQAGVGNAVSLTVGGKTDRRHGRPVPIRGRVVEVSEGVFEEPEARHGGVRVHDQGLTAVIETEDGHTVVVNSLRVMPTSLQQLLSLNIRPERHKAIVVKGVTAPRAAYDSIAAEVIAVDSPGVTQAGPEAFDYQHRPRPLYPLEPLGPWTPAAL